MLKISAVITATVVLAGLLVSGPSGLGVAETVAAADASIVRVKTIIIRPSVLPTEVSSFVSSTKFQARANFRRNSSRMAALD